MKALGLFFSQKQQIFPGLGKGVEAIFIKTPAVLNSDAANARQIDPRLNGKAHSCFQLLLASRLQIHRLMDLHPNPVTQAVGKVLPVAR